MTLLLPPWLNPGINLTENIWGKNIKYKYAPLLIYSAYILSQTQNSTTILYFII